MIVIENLRKSFDNNQVLQGLNLTIRDGETLVIIGRSGCGKSILLKHIIGLMQPDEGKVLIDDVDIASLSRRELDQFRLKIGMVFQGAALFDSLTVEGNVGFSLYEHSDLPPEEIHRRVQEKLRMVGLQGVEDLMPSELSGGMKKRVSIARALCNDPRRILYDEPTTGLDPITADVVNNLIGQFREKLKVTSVVVTHDMISAYKIADRIAMLYQGRIIAVGEPEEIQHSKDPFVRQFILGLASGPITDGERKFFVENENGSNSLTSDSKE
ncbi:MAG TPA: ABC transporter ATP-binding protein [Candidatus Omnitrophota bacterium]|nr:ABC transporter ATP-binding protein [Candidatus Omnitrophota bacterium]